MEFGYRLKKLREEKEITQLQLAKILGLDGSTISFYESGKRQPDYKILKGIADYFNVSLDFLLSRTDNPQNTPAPILLSPLRIPILGTIHAGLPVLAEENWEDEIELPSEFKADFALRVKGDSMSWVGIHENDLALMRQADLASHGMIVAAGLEEMEWQATLKFYVQDNGYPILRAANPAYEDIKITEKHRIIGQLVKVIKDPPSLQKYKEILVDKDLSDKGWSDAIETAVQMGFDSKNLKKAVDVFRWIKKGL
jgi:repressor LexA